MLAAHWLRPITHDETEQGYWALLAEAGRRRCRRWLLDVRRHRNTHQLGTVLMVSTLLPKPGPRLGGRTRLAYLLMPAFRRGQKADAAFWPM